MTTKFLRLSVLGLFLGTTTLLRAAIAPAENLLPADTLAFITVPDCNALRAATKTSPQLMFWNDPSMKPFRDKFMAKLTEKLLAPLEKDLGLKTDDFLALLQGQFTVAITASTAKADEDTPPGVVLLLDAKDKSDVLKTNLATLTKKWNAGGRTLRTEKIHGLPFTVVTLTSNDVAAIFPKKARTADADKPAKPGEIFFTQYQSLLLVGSSAPAVESVAARLTGGSAPCLADDATFAADKLSQFRDSPLDYGWLNTAKIFNLFTADKSDEAEATPGLMPQFSPAKILNATGLNGLKSASFAVRDRGDGSSVTLHLTAPESTRAGLLKILALPAKDAGIPAFVPADVVKFTRLRLDGKQTWAELQKIVSSISPQYLASLNSVIDMANTMAQMKNPAFDLRTYLFGNLGDDLITYQKAPKDQTLQALAEPPTIFLLAVGNTDQAIDAIKTLAGMGAPQDSTTQPREFQGRKIYTIALRGKRAPGGAAATPGSLYLSASGGYLAISKDIGLLEEYLRSSDGKNKSLREVPGITEAAGKTGGMGGGLFTYENQRETMRSAFKLVKGTGAGNPLQMLPPGFRDWADFSLLPEFDQVAKFFWLSVSSASVNGDGLTMKVYTPRPPQLK